MAVTRTWVTCRRYTFFSTILYLLTSFQVFLHGCQIPTAMSDLKSLNTSLLEVMISSKKDRVIIRDLNDITLQTIFNAWCASINVGSSALLLGRILDMRHHGGSICIVELSSPAALASSGSFVIKFFAVRHNMGPAQWANSCWQKHTSLS